MNDYVKVRALRPFQHGEQIRHPHYGEFEMPAGDAKGLQEQGLLAIAETPQASGDASTPDDAATTRARAVRATAARRKG